MTRFLTSCHGRRETQYEPMTWWDYVEAERWYSPEFKNLLAGVPRTMVAMHANKGSARTIGSISAQLMFDFTRGRKDATMTGPTNETWLVPWRLHLERQQVRIFYHHALAAFDFDGAAISSARVRTPDGEQQVVADYYVSAVPLEKMQGLLEAMPDLCEFDESLARIVRLAEATEWMVGAQFYLKKDIGICRGHAFYPNAAWGLTTISQAQFWERLMNRSVADHFGIPELRGVLSVDISDWSQPNERGKTARDCQSRDEILDEVWT